MLRKLALSLALAGALSSSNSYALGLGDIKINSALNEPLNAEIQLLEARKLNPLQIQPRMADIDEYVLAGIDKQRFLSDVTFKVILGPDGNGRIRLTSRDPVKEPFLNFLVEVNWPNGRLVREYTLLLDPPAFDPSAQRRTVQPARTVQRPPAVVAQPAPQEPKPVAVAPVKNIRTEMTPRQVFVDVHDSLWSISDKYRPNETVTKSQMALALLKKNPGAFVGNNINRMKAGVVLDLPTLDEINALTAKEAAAEVLRQNDAWKNRGRKAAPKAPAKPLVATVKRKEPEKAADAAPKPLVRKEVPVVQPEPEAPPADDAALKELEDARLALEQQLNSTQDEVGELQGENELLSDRLEMMQGQLASIQTTIDSKDQNIAALEARLAEQQARIDESEKGFFTKLMENPLYLAGIGGGLVLLLIGALVALFLKRRKAKKQEEESDDASGAAAAAAAGVAAVAAADAIAEDETDEVTEPEAEETGVDADSVGEAPAEEAADDLQDLSDLDLDMDLDLDLDDSDMLADTVEPVADGGDTLLDDDEFDLGLDDDAASDTADGAEDEDLENLLVNDLGEDLSDSALELDSELDDGDLEFNTSSPVETSDELDDILSSDSELESDLSVDDLGIDFDDIESIGSADAEEKTDDSGDLEFDIDDIGLDDLGLDDEPAAEAGSEEVSAAELEVESPDDIVDADDIEALLAQAAAETEGEEDLLDLAADLPEVDATADVAAEEELTDIDDIDALLAQASAEVDGEEDLLDLSDIAETPEEPAVAEPEESLDAIVDVDDIDALLAEVNEPVVADEPAEAEAPELTDDDLTSSLLDDADLDSLLADTAQLADEKEKQEEAELDLTEEPEMDLDDLLASVGIDEAELEEVTEPESDQPEAAVESDFVSDDIELDELDLSGLETAEDEEPLGDADALLADLESLVNEDEQEDGLATSEESDVTDLLSELELDLTADEGDAPEAKAETAEDALADLESELGLDTDLELDLDALSAELEGDAAEPAGDTVAPEVELTDELALDDDLLSELSLEDDAEEVLSAPAEQSDFDAEVESLLNEVVEKSDLQPAVDAADDLAVEEDASESGVADLEPEQPLEIEDLDEIDLDLGDMDLDQLLEEAASEDVAEAPAAPEVATGEDSTEEVSDTAELDEISAQLGDLEELDISDVIEGLDDVGSSDLADLDLDFELEESDLTGGDSAAGEVADGPVNEVEEELTANIVHDLDAELDSELQSLLNGTDGDIELEETDADEEDLEEIDGWALLEGADELETKLDLARAYIDMEDADGAREILQEIINEGSDQQKQEAGDLLESLSSL